MLVKKVKKFISENKYHEVEHRKLQLWLHKNYPEVIDEYDEENLAEARIIYG